MARVCGLLHMVKHVDLSNSAESVQLRNAIDYGYVRGFSRELLEIFQAVCLL